jgi:hypothetical protein
MMIFRSSKFALSDSLHRKSLSTTIIAFAYVMVVEGSFSGFLAFSCSHSQAIVALNSC